MFPMVIEELKKLEFDDDIKYNVSKKDMRDFSIKLIQLVERCNRIKDPLEREYQKMTPEERQRLIDANVDIMEKYKEAFLDIKTLVGFLDGEELDKDVAYKIIAKYRDRKIFKEDWEE